MEEGDDRANYYDAGTYPDILEHNAMALGADLEAVDIAIFSHSHIDHTGGLAYLLKINPDFKLFLPSDWSLGAILSLRSLIIGERA